MSPPQLRVVSTSAQRAPAFVSRRGKRAEPRLDRPLLGQILLESGAISPGNLVKALALQQRAEARLGDILLAHRWVSRRDLDDALARQWAEQAQGKAQNSPAAGADYTRGAASTVTANVGPVPCDADAALVAQYGAAQCLRDGVMPLRRIGGAVLVASARPDLMRRHKPKLEATYGQVAVTFMQEERLTDRLLTLAEPELVARAEARPAAELSCRSFSHRSGTRWILGAALLTVFAALVFAPEFVGAVFVGWAMLSLLGVTAMKAIAGGLTIWEKLFGPSETFTTTRSDSPAIARLPTVSVLVPLFNEPQIVARLIKRLSKQTYPKELTDICLVVEADDTVTQQAIATARLPHWMRLITVPRGGLKTKPRALNYALDLTRGSIVGIWDAEDAPAADQLHRIVRHFHARGAQVACVQGVLDFYNCNSNWLTRCFAIEYAAWFRVILRGAARLRLPVPLGGTTVFFRRDALEEVGAWDAHNVTEDADLGIRLARAGYQTELIRTVTGEEANGRLIPWIKQRSRWLKGYAKTWAVHMRRPWQLWKDLGGWGFLWVQLLFLGTLSQFALAPLLWSFWLVPLGLPHPLVDSYPFWVLMAISSAFLFSELTSVVINVIAARDTGHKGLWVWVPTLVFYFPIAALACYKALIELVWAPYYWDKTSHGHDDEGDETMVELEVRGTID